MRKSIYLLLFLLSTIPIIAQDFEDYVSSYTGINGKGYMKPLADAFGANVNSGFFHDARIPLLGVNVYFGVVGMTAFISDDSRTFEATTGEFFSPEQTAKVPTIFGSTQSLKVDGTGGTQFSFPGGLNISKVPIAVPQLTIGAIAGTDFTLRYIQLNVDDNFGDIKVLGVGARHSIDQYLPLVPIDIAFGVYYQTFDIGNIIEASAMLISAQASYSTPVVTFYGGLGYETSNMDISYDVGTELDPEKIKFEVDATNSIRLTLGAALKLGFFILHTDYNLASQNVWAVGLGFNF